MPALPQHESHLIVFKRYDIERLDFLLVGSRRVGREVRRVGLLFGTELIGETEVYRSLIAVCRTLLKLRLFQARRQAE